MNDTATAERGAPIDRFFREVDEARAPLTYAEVNARRRAKEAAILARLGLTKPVAQSHLCECGDEFSNAGGLAAHQAFCKTAAALANPAVTHGTLTAYSYHSCRCEPCREGYREYQRAYYLKRRAEQAGAFAKQGKGDDGTVIYEERECRVCGEVKPMPKYRRVCNACRRRSA